MRVVYLTIGYIPDSCTAPKIICGDPVESETEEISVRIEGNKVSSIDTNLTIEVNPIDFFNQKSNLWITLVNNFCPDFINKGIKPNLIAGCWSIFIDEVSDVKGIKKLADEDDCGEFHNIGGSKNGSFYVRLQYEEDGEYYGEKVLGF